MAPAFPSPRRVFLNIPFDARYKDLFVALIGGLTALGGEPHSVLEVPSAGLNRLDRIYDLIASCAVSIHDLSRAGLSGPLRVPRFNMPFELGMAYSLARFQPHRFFVLEEKPHRLQTTLSDLNGLDPHIHGGTQEGILRCILDCFGMPGQTPRFVQLLSLTNRLRRTALEMQRELGLRDPFHPFMFRQLVGAAARLAREEGLIR